MDETVTIWNFLKKSNGLSHIGRNWSICSVFQPGWKYPDICSLWFLISMASRSRGFFRTLFYSLLLSLGVEVMQLVTRVGSFDVDDILLNTLGGVLGYILFMICNAIRRRHYARTEKALRRGSGKKREKSGERGNTDRQNISIPIWALSPACLRGRPSPHLADVSCIPIWSAARRPGSWRHRRDSLRPVCSGNQCGGKGIQRKGEKLYHVQDRAAGERCCADPVSGYIYRRTDVTMKLERKAERKK